MHVVEEFDHFVVPVDDLVAAEEFYPRVFGGQIVRRNGLSVREWKLGRIPHTFVDVAGKRLGVYLQSDERPAPAGLRGSPTYSFETTEQGLDEVADALRASNVRWDGPFEEDRTFAARSVYLNDPAGNHFHIYVPNQARAHEADGERMAAVGYLELEAPDLDASIRFYEQALGLELLGVGTDDTRGLRQATMRLPNGQILLLTEVEAFAYKGLLMSRTIPGPHLGFLVRGENWTAALAHLDALGIPNADRGVEGKARAAGEVGTYMDDPAGNVIQFITDGAPAS
jgi:extradiol dioxygenase family protein